MPPNELRALGREPLGELAALLPAGPLSLTVRLVEPLHVLSLRMLPGGASAIVAAMAAPGIDALPAACRFTGDDSRLLWRNPTELLFVAASQAQSEHVLDALQAAPDALAYAVDQSDGLTALAIEGVRLDDVLHRLMDAASVPLEPGQVVRARMADIAVIVVRLGPDQAWLITDRANDRYLAQWVAYATEALAVSS